MPDYRYLKNIAEEEEKKRLSYGEKKRLAYVEKYYKEEDRLVLFIVEKIRQQLQNSIKQFYKNERKFVDDEEDYRFRSFISKKNFFSKEYIFGGVNKNFIVWVSNGIKWQYTEPDNLPFLTLRDKDIDCYDIHLPGNDCLNSLVKKINNCLNTEEISVTVETYAPITDYQEYHLKIVANLGNL